MKKIVLLLVLLAYLIPVIGVTVSAHYCGGYITWVSINFEQTEHKCACGSKKMKTDCCKDKTAFVKLKNEQRNSTFGVDVNCPWGLHLPINYPSFCSSISLQSNAIASSNISPPPDVINQRIYLRYCTFLI